MVIAFSSKIDYLCFRVIQLCEVWGIRLIDFRNQFVTHPFLSLILQFVNQRDSLNGNNHAQDVIYLTYNTAISDELAQAVLAWLRADTGRVLIVGTDTEATNAKLRQYLTSDGTWKYYYQNNIGGNFKRAAQTDANRRFFTTPFGQVAENAVVSRADNYAAYCSDYPSAVTPLLVSTAAGQEKTLSVGVNQTSRIVYLGDANLNQNGSLSTQANATGTVTTDFDRLTANLWAWIVEQVCQNG